MTNITRSYPIGSEWLYFKLYCGTKTADDILISAIKPLKNEFLKNGLIDKWFFIRYADPDSHLRVRFHLTATENTNEVIKLFNQYIAPFTENDLLWKIQADTYKPEIVRYGNDTMKLSESLFYYDSEFITDFVDLIEGDEGENIRWLFSLKCIDSLLDDFLYTDKQKLKLIENLKIAYGNEFGVNKELKIQLDKKYRIENQNINNILKKEQNTSSKLKSLFDILDIKSENTSLLTDQIINTIQSNGSQISINNLLSSYIHMLMNRLFKSKQRLHEMVVYDFLFRYYKSELAKQKYNLLK